MPSKKDIAEESAKILREALPPRDGPKRRKWIWIVLPCTFLLIAGIAVLATSQKTSQPEPSGKITQPENGSRSPRTIIISGYTENIPANKSEQEGRTLIIKY